MANPPHTGRRLLRPVLFFWHVHKKFVHDEGLVLAGNIAFSTLLAFFPFLIFLTALAGYVGNEDLARTAIDYLLSVAPHEVVAPVRDDIHSLLTAQNGGILTVSILMTVFVASSGVESLRIGFNRAYGFGVKERRAWWLRRLQNLVFVFGGAAVLLVLAVFIVFAPIWWGVLAQHFTIMSRFTHWFYLLRLPVGLSVMFVALLFGHLFLPRRRLPVRQVLPGIFLTMTVWLIAARAYAVYTVRFSKAQIMYAGLGSVVIALIFVYISAALIIWGAAFNEALIHRRTLKSTRETQGGEA